MTSSLRQTPESSRPVARIARRAALWTAWIAGLYCAFVSLLLLVYGLQSRAADPLNSPALQALRARLEANPEDAALRDEVRALDSLARHAFFGGIRFLRTGVFLLLGGMVVFLAAMGGLRALRGIVPCPGRYPGPMDGARAGEQARAALGAFGLLLGCLALVFAMAPGRSPLPAESVPPSDASAQLDVQELSDSSDSSDSSDLPAQSGSPGASATADGATDPTEPAGGVWPCFRGPGGLGVASAGPAPPTAWDGASGSNILWAFEPALPGFSSPIVWGNRLYVTGASAEERVIQAVNVESGELVWTFRVEAPGGGGEAPTVNEETGYAAPTPVTDGTRIAAIFANGDIAAVDAEGERLWAMNLGLPENHYGHSSSLMLHRGVLVVQYDRTDAAEVMGIDMGTGKILWMTIRDVRASWASPIVVERAGRAEVILAADPIVAAYDPASGAELWQIDAVGGEIGASPAYDGARVFAANAYYRLAAIDPSGPSIAWVSESDLPEASSPVAVGGLLFVPTSEGVVSCYDASTGALHWQHEFDAGFYSSAVISGGRVYLADRAGVTHVFLAAATFTPVSTSALGEKVDATPAIAGGRLFLRGRQHVFAVGE